MAEATVLFYTANCVPEAIGQRVLRQLSISAAGLPLVSVSQQPINLGENICLGDIGHSHINVYRQLLAGARAIQGKWVIYQEDDILYPPEHFLYRPSAQDLVAYDMNKWSLYTWRPRVYYRTAHRPTSGCIVARELMLAALEERFAKHPDPPPEEWGNWAELGRHENRLCCTPIKVEEFNSEIPTVIFFHEQALGYKVLGRRKYRGNEVCAELPYWGRALDILNGGQGG